MKYKAQEGLSVTYVWNDGRVVLRVGSEVFWCGYMESSLRLAAYCERNGYGFIRFESDPDCLTRAYIVETRRQRQNVFAIPPLDTVHEIEDLLELPRGRLSGELGMEQFW